MQAPPGVGEIHLAEDTPDPLLPVRPVMARASCPGVGIDNEERSFVYHLGLIP